MYRNGEKSCYREGNISELRAHVQLSNKSAIQFYHSCAFEDIETIENYYNADIGPTRDALYISWKVPDVNNINNNISSI